MKFLHRLLAVSSLFLACGTARAEVHEFKLPDGRSIKAELMDYNVKLGLAELKLENGKCKRIKPAIFVKEDQEYILNWAKLAAFRSPSLFKITCKTSLVERWKDVEEASISYEDGSVERETTYETKFEKFVYEVVLDNKNKVPLENIKFDYRIYYEQGTAKMKKDAKKPKIISGNLELRRLSPKQKTTLKTNPVVIHVKEFVGDFEYTSGVLPEPDKGDIIGIWLKAYTKGTDGKMITRDVYHPSSLAGKYIW